MQNTGLRVGGWGAAVLAAALLSACAYPGDPYGGSQYGGSQPGGYGGGMQGTSGYAQRVRVVDVEYGQANTGIGGTGISTGAVIGGVVGGLVANQIGSGTGRVLATLAGVAGGAVAGDRIEKSRNSSINSPYRVTVQLPNGGTRYFDYSHDPQLRVGDYVRMENDQLFR